MGGKLSPSLANIFVHMLEENIIQDYIDNGIIISYQRYVDDVAIILKKGYKQEILNKFNQFDPGLKWTVENFENNKLVFLDTEIPLKNGNLELYQYRKPSVSECVTNYKYGISPKALDKALLNLKSSICIQKVRFFSKSSLFIQKVRFVFKNVDLYSKNSIFNHKNRFVTKNLALFAKNFAF